MRTASIAIWAIILGVLLSTGMALAQEKTATSEIIVEELVLPPLEYPLNNVSWSPNGEMLALSGDTILWVYDANTLEILHVFEGHKDAVTALAWSPDSCFLTSGGWENTIYIWEIATGQVATTFEEHKQRVTSISWQPNGKFVASGGWDDMVYVWSPNSGESIASLEVHREGYPVTVNAVAWHPNNETLAVGGAASQIQFWNINTNETQAKIDPDGPINTFAWSSDGNEIAVQVDHTQIWDVTTKELVVDLGHETRRVVALDWSPNNKWLATNSLDETTRIWDTETWHTMATLKNGLVIKDPFSEIDYANTLAWSSDSKHLASVGEDGILRVWDLSAL